MVVFGGLVATAPGLAVQKSDSELQMEFGVKVAMKGSWLEAAFRFEKAIKLGGGTARAWNNLAVARESLGRFDEAKEAYEKALSLKEGGEPDERIRENYERLMGFINVSRKGTVTP